MCWNECPDEPVRMPCLICVLTIPLRLRFEFETEFYGPVHTVKAMFMLFLRTLFLGKRLSSACAFTVDPCYLDFAYLVLLTYRNNPKYWDR